MWRDNDVQVHGEGTKRLLHPILGPIELEYSGFAVDGRPDLGLIVSNPSSPSDADRIRSLLESATGPKSWSLAARRCPANATRIACFMEVTRPVPCPLRSHRLRP